MQRGHWCEEAFIFIFLPTNNDLLKNKLPQAVDVKPEWLGSEGAQ